MKNSSVPPFILSIIFFLLLVSTLYFAKSAQKARMLIDAQSIKLNACNLNLQMARKKPAFDLNNLYLFAQKQKTIEKSEKGLLHFSSNITKTGQNTWIVNIVLSGGENIITDSADLVIEFEPDVRVTDVDQGDAYPHYPRLEHNDRSLIATGLADIQNNTIVFGRSQKTFITFEVHSEKPTVSLFINENDSTINFAGEKIIDSQLSLKKIVLK